MWHEAHEDDWMIKMESFALGIWGDWLKKWDEMTSLAKVVQIVEEFLIISYTHQYKLEWLIRVWQLTKP